MMLETPVISSPVVLPATRRLALSDGHWVLVKERLNAGEMMDLYDSAAVENPDLTAPPQVHHTKAALAIVLAYLLDWSFVDPAGVPIPIRGADPDTVRGALRSFDLEWVQEIMEAIGTHDRAMRQKKRRPVGAIVSS